ncbi:hypothetical protein C2S52_009588 [Perilla frutescens var. hirtella]|nr:hypothetical protein C2S51_016931 [Perilla frutescens var. frutescens]KAH6784629.1 hypothetical protein C2S52_009588 [Perilla frutescens var. hirtella]
MDMEESIDVDARRRLQFHESDNENELGGKNGKGLVNDSQLEIVDKTIPRIGMEFDSEDAAYNFYNEYAKVVGFGIRRHSVHFDRNGIVLERTFCCRSQGHRGKDNRDAGNKFHQPLTRTCCEAKMKINSRHNGKYRVTGFIVEHSGHDLPLSGKHFYAKVTQKY